MSVDPGLVAMADKIVRWRGVPGIRRWFFYCGRCVAFHWSKP